MAHYINKYLGLFITLNFFYLYPASHHHIPPDNEYKQELYNLGRAGYLYDNIRNSRNTALKIRCAQNLNLTMDRFLSVYHMEAFNRDGDIITTETYRIILIEATLEFEAKKRNLAPEEILPVKEILHREIQGESQ